TLRYLWPDMRKDHARIFCTGGEIADGYFQLLSRSEINDEKCLPRPRHRHARLSGLGSKELVGSDQEGVGLKLFSIPSFVPRFR
ncbi:MAG TPA: hypothetical protein VIK24_08985, partial [Pyrinomonadaceae bacterium]